MNTIRLLSLAALLATFGACSSPTPRGTADPGVTQNQNPRSLNAPYYTGSDPDYPRGGRAGRSGGGS
jgi:hypothetical protein